MDVLMTLQFFIPLFGSLVVLFSCKRSGSTLVTQLVAILSVVFSLATLWIYMSDADVSSYMNWGIRIPILEMTGASFSFAYTGIGGMLCLLTSFAFLIVAFLPPPLSAVKQRQLFIYFSLLLFCQCALYGVFMASDALFFYCFWELVLIPILFIASSYGGKLRARVTTSFFLYTLTASLFMLVGILYIYAHTVDRSFAYFSFVNANFQDSPYFNVIFWFMFIAFAVKTPLFPFHSWQSQLYVQSPTTLTIILSAVVAKMGLFGIFRWLLPVFSSSLENYAWLIAFISIAGLLYGSVIALQQKNLKSLLAYSSFAHLGLMGASLFTANAISMTGALFQMMSHGLVVLGLWWIVHIIEEAYQTTNLGAISGLVNRSPFLSVLFVVFALANIALPLTSSFVGEWMMLAGIFSSEIIPFWVILCIMFVGGLSIVFGAVYTLNMLRGVLYGERLKKIEAIELGIYPKLGMALLLLAVLFAGIYPNLFIHFFEMDVNALSDIIDLGLL